ncbi:hypothetical protein [Anabaena sp. CCY 9910]|uniref:hypothetical protein n=1 Tax=Anabaena sp. CCY 9910 TaxID=3103870 RepID=UPI0039E02052
MLTNTDTLNNLLTQAQSTLEQIKRHPDYQNIQYSPDFTITDALAAVEELAQEIRH